MRAILRDQANAQVMLGEVDEIDPGRRTVTLTGAGGGRRDVGFDFLVVAVGAEPGYFGHDDWARHLFPMKTLDQALALRSRILDAYEVAAEEPDPVQRDMWTTFAIVGAGPTGEELAGELVTVARRLRAEFHGAGALRPHVVLVDAGPEVLASFPPRLREHARRRLGKMGVEIRTGRQATGVDDHGIDLSAPGNTSERIDARTVIWAAASGPHRLPPPWGGPPGRRWTTRAGCRCGPTAAFPVTPASSPSATRPAWMTCRACRSRPSRRDGTWRR